MRLIFIIYCSLLLFSCSQLQPTTYQESNYEDRKISNRTYEVKYYVVPTAQEVTAVKYCLYRCAELTDENGFKYFEILSKDVGLHFNSITGGTSYMSTVKIRMFNETPEKMTEEIYNAKRFLLINSDVID